MTFLRKNYELRITIEKKIDLTTWQFQFPASGLRSKCDSLDQKKILETEMNKMMISCTSKELKTPTSKMPAFSIWGGKSVIVISTLFCALMHWIILTSIQKSNYLSEKLMATSRATLPVKESYHFLCDVTHKTLIHRLLDQLLIVFA